MEETQRARSGLFPGADVLHAQTPQEVIRRLLATGSFGLEGRAERYLRETGYLLFPERFAARVLARVAFEAMSYAGAPLLGEWLDNCIEMAARDLCNEQFAEEALHLPVPRSADAEYYEQVSEATGFELELTRLVCLTVNHLPEEARRAWHSVVVRGKSINRYVAEGNGPPEHVQKLLGDTSRSILLVLEPPDEQGDPA